MGRASVLGFSMGGNAAQQLAVQHPERVDRLVLASTFARMNAQARLFLDAVLDTYEHNRRPAQLLHLVYPWLFSIGFLSDPVNAELLAAVEAAPDDQLSEAWRALYLAQPRFDGRSRLRDVDAPTLVIAGDEDRLVSPDDARELGAREQFRSVGIRTQRRYGLTASS